MGKQGVKQPGGGELKKKERLKDRKQRRSGYSLCEKGDEETENKASPCKQL